MNMSTKKLRTNRNFWKYFFLQFLTLDIYEAVMMSNISKEVNLVAKDGKRTMDYMKIFLTSIIALLMLAVGMFLGKDFYAQLQADVYDPDFKAKIAMFLILASLIIIFVVGIVVLVWTHRISDRIGNEIKRRNLGYEFGSKTIWMWLLVALTPALLMWLLCLVLQIGEPLQDILTGVPALIFYVYYYRLIKAMNLLNADYNSKGE